MYIWAYFCTLKTFDIHYVICGSPHVVFTFNRLRRVVKPTVYIPISRNVYPIFTRYKIVRFARPHHVYNNITAADAYIPEVGDCLFVFPELSVLCVCVCMCVWGGGGGSIDRRRKWNRNGGDVFRFRLILYTIY